MPSPPPRPETAIAKHYLAGTHRQIEPAQTIAKLRPLLPAMGITRVANVTGLDRIGIPVVMVCRPNARSLAVAQGKGLTLDAARASGVMESIELYHAETITHPLKLAAHHELARLHRLVDVTRLPRLSIGGFHDHLRLLWIEGFELLRGVPVWLPYEVVHTCYTLPLPPGSGAFVSGSNGLASGNHVLEAITHGIAEVIERDATTLFHLGGDAARRRTRVDLATIDDASCRSVLDRYDRADVAVAVWEVTTDIGVPVFFCSIADRAPHPLHPLYASSGMGCHPAREIALLRALTEAAQSRLTTIAGSRDDGGRDKYEHTRDPEVLRAVRAEMAEGGPTRSFRDAPSRQHATFDEDLRWMLGCLHTAGIQEVIVVDLTKTDAGFAVVRVVIPGLESVYDAPGYTPGPRGRRALQERGA